MHTPTAGAVATTAAPHDGRCTLPGLAAEEVLARLFIFIGQRDQRGLADCFAQLYRESDRDVVARWAAAGPVRQFAFVRLPSAEDVALFRVTAELIGGAGDWKGLATRQVTLRLDPDRWAVATID